VIDAEGHGDSRTSRAEVDRRQCVAHLARRGSSIDLVSDAERASIVVPPTLERTVVEPRTRVREANPKIHCRAARAAGHGRERIAHLTGSVASDDLVTET